MFYYYHQCSKLKFKLECTLLDINLIYASGSEFFNNYFIGLGVPGKVKLPLLLLFKHIGLFETNIQPTLTQSYYFSLLTFYFPNISCFKHHKKVKLNLRLISKKLSIQCTDNRIWEVNHYYVETRVAAHFPIGPFKLKEVFKQA